MSEKRGYPNPNYTEDDVMTEEEAILEEVGLVTLPVDHYEELVSKAAALDILTASIRRRGKVIEEVVYAVTGAEVDPEIEKLKKESSERLDWYWTEKTKNEELRERVRELEAKLKELKEEEDGQD